ncbi:MAG: Unknown protein [uncultured Thiotrichaceae bacterium]|uniref:Uncharacterized protein n=1 Tax=uncultured Thiotrichaceae bacterium TaxID=298394 RepID=A0A6S6TEV3_9GAMM|nr:MAG: Unknown protein [uncultured Thiotrichaceae bacterium]
MGRGFLCLLKFSQLLFQLTYPLTESAGRHPNMGIDTGKPEIFTQLVGPYLLLQAEQIEAGTAQTPEKYIPFLCLPKIRFGILVSPFISLQMTVNRTFTPMALFCELANTLVVNSTNCGDNGLAASPDALGNRGFFVINSA